MAKSRNRHVIPRWQPAGGGLWSCEEFMFGVTGGAISLTGWRGPRHRSPRR